MGPVEVTAGIAAVLVAVVVGVWVAARRRRDRRRRDAVERRDALVRAQVLERLAAVTAQWEGRADEDWSDGSHLPDVADVPDVPDLPGLPDDGVASPGRVPVAESGPGAGVPGPAAVTALGHPVDEHPRHRRPGHGIRVRRHRRA